MTSRPTKTSRSTRRTVATSCGCTRTSVRWGTPPCALRSRSSRTNAGGGNDRRGRGAVRVVEPGRGKRAPTGRGLAGATRLPADILAGGSRVSLRVGGRSVHRAHGRERVPELLQARVRQGPLVLRGVPDGFDADRPRDRGQRGVGQAPRRGAVVQHPPPRGLRLPRGHADRPEGDPPWIWCGGG